MIQSKIKPERIYIGSTQDIYKRFHLHKSKLQKNKHHTPKLQNHCNKYGFDDFVFTILEECNKDNLMEREQYYIDVLKPWFNSRLIAESNAGYKHTEGAKKKIGESKIGKKLSKEHRDALKVGWEKRRLIPMSQETRIKFSEAAKGRKPWSAGLTKETDARLKSASDKKMGKVVKQETRDKISNTLSGKPHTAEHNKKVGDALRGKKQSTEVIEAKRKRVLEWWRKKKEENMLL